MPLHRHKEQETGHDRKTRSECGSHRSHAGQNREEASDRRRMWRNLESPTMARANIRRHVKRLLQKYGYPPDLQDAAVQNVLQQAEALSAEWSA
jgi:hypothetical protein